MPEISHIRISDEIALSNEMHRADAWELESLRPEHLATELREAINGVIDREAFEHEREQEAKDARHIEATRNAVLKALPGLTGGHEKPDGN